MRTAFHDRLDGLAQHLARTCRMAGDSMDLATQALLNTDLVTAEA